jgi:hypothetical protein
VTARSDSLQDRNDWKKSLSPLLTPCCRESDTLLPALLHHHDLSTATLAALGLGKDGGLSALENESSPEPSRSADGK